MSNLFGVRSIGIQALILFAVLTAVAAEPQVLPVWPKGAPGSEGKTELELIENTGRTEHRVSRIHNPTLTVYLPPKEKATGAAVIIVPGGGHRFLSIDSEGYNVAKWLSEHGIAGMVLKHRLARETNSTYQVEVHSLQDVQRSIRLVRSRASEWGIDSARVGVLGFSAGGELAVLASMRYDGGNAGAADPVERENSKPAFQALMYPGGLKGLKPTKDSPPAFLACAVDDRPEIAGGLAEAYLAFKRAGVSTELHIYASGGHGFGYRETSTRPIGQWLPRMAEWMQDRGFLKNGK